MTSIAKSETSNLIASSKVEGTNVYNPAGDKLGSIYNFMVDKRSGEVEYAVLQFGGFLGVGSDYYPLPWEALTYDETKAGYVVDIDPKTLAKAPHYPENAEPAFDDAYAERVYGAYDLTY